MDEEEMRVPLDETGEQRRSGQRDRHRVTRRRDLRLRTHGLDFVAAHEHGPALMRRAVAVPDSIRDEKGWRTGRSGAASTAPALCSGQTRAQRDQTDD